MALIILITPATGITGAASTDVTTLSATLGTTHASIAPHVALATFLATAHSATAGALIFIASCAAAQAFVITTRTASARSWILTTLRTYVPGFALIIFAFVALISFVIPVRHVEGLFCFTMNGR